MKIVVDAMGGDHAPGVVVDGAVAAARAREVLFAEYLAVTADKSAATDPLPLIQRVSEIIQRMHKDGTLLRLSRQFYNLDLVTPAAEFDLGALNQW